MKRHLYPLDPITGEPDKTLTIWEKICSMDNLRLAHKNASRKKKRYKEVIEVEKDLENKLQEIHDMLVNRTYVPAPYIKFLREEHGKVREIYKSPYFPERIIQWAVLQVISPILLKQFIYDTYSAIPDKGIHLALHRVKHDIQTDRVGTAYCLKMDVKKYYPSVDRNILIDDYRHLFKDEGLLWYLEKNITTAPDTGILIGNYLSQFGGNYYLSPFDHWIKEVKKEKYYYRYMDDIVILHSSKEHLHELEKEIIEYFDLYRGLHVKGNYQVFPVADRGLDFVGYRVFPDYVLLRKSTATRLKTKMTYMKEKVDKGVPLSYSDYCRFNSYGGWLKHCDGHRLYQKYLAPLEQPINNYYLTVIKGGKRKNESNRKGILDCETESSGVRQQACVCA